MSKLTKYGSISRDKSTTNPILNSIKFLKKVLINLISEIEDRDSSALTQLIDDHIGDREPVHVFPDTLIESLKTRGVYDDFMRFLNEHNIPLSTPDEIAAFLNTPIEEWVDENSPDNAVFDCVTFDVAMENMFDVMLHSDLVDGLDNIIVETPPTIRTYTEGNPVNYCLGSEKALAIMEQNERDILAAKVQKPRTIDFDSHADNAIYTIPNSQGWVELVDLSMYGEGTIDIYRKKLEYYQNYTEFDVWSSPSAEQVAHQSLIRQPHEYAKVHNVMGFNEQIGIFFEIDLRSLPAGNCDILNLVGRSKSQMALMIRTDGTPRIVLERDGYDVTKSEVVVPDISGLDTLRMFIDFADGQIIIAFWDGSSVTYLIRPKLTRVMMEPIFYLFICPFVGVYKEGCVRIGRVEIIAESLDSNQIEMMLKQ